MKPTPTTHDLPLRRADFPTLTDALDYSAGGNTGLNFYRRGELSDVVPYHRLQAEARQLARKLLATGIPPRERVALVAETTPGFVRSFFACLYAGLVPVPLPAAVKIGSHEAFVEQLRDLLKASRAQMAVASPDFTPFLAEAADGEGLRKVGSYDSFDALPEAEHLALPAIGPDDTAFIQYTSGSTRAPKGVVVTHGGAMSNLQGIAAEGVRVVPGDRCTSWLPFYHDMGLVGFLLVPLASQLSVDYMPTTEFAMRPGQWLRLITRNRATISFSPCFGFDLCARRLRERELASYDLSSWRVAGVGAEMIRPDSLDRFAECTAAAGFDARAFLPCYGMAERTLAVSFSEPGTGYRTDYVSIDHLHCSGRVVPQDRDKAGSGRQFVHCGRPLSGLEVEIRDEAGEVLGDYQAGVIHLRGPAVMAGYFEMPEITRETLSEDGWLCTGDIGYRAEGSLVLTGRQKDLIIINGRNIWPQDIEYLCETRPQVRMGDAVAFSIPSDDEGESCVVLLQCRETDAARRQLLRRDLTGLIRRELGIDCLVVLVPPRSIPLTSSGKCSRSKARQNFLESLADAENIASAAGT